MCVYCRNIKFVIIFSSDSSGGESCFLMTLLHPSQIGRQQDPVEKNSSRVSVSGTCEAQEDAPTANWVICKTVLQVCYFRLLNFFLGIIQQPELMRIIIVKYLKQIEVRYQTTPPIVFHWRAEGGDFLLWLFFHHGEHYSQVFF